MDTPAQVTDGARSAADKWGIAGSRRFEGMALEAAGELAAASARYADATAAFASAGLPINALPVLSKRALVQLRLGQIDSARTTLALGDRLGKTTDAWVNEAAVVRAIILMREGNLDGADSLLRSTRTARNWRAGSTSLTSVTLESREALLALRMNRMAVAETALTTVTAALDTWRRRPSNASFSASLAQLRTSWGGLSDVFPEIIGQLAARDRTDLAFTLVEQLRARELTERALRTVAAVADSGRGERLLARQRQANLAMVPAVADVQQVQRALQPDEAFVAYVLGLDDVSTTALVVTRDRVSALTLPGRNALVADIRRVVQLAEAGTEAVAAGRRLGAALLAPVFATVPESVTRLLVSTDGELHRIPFDVLRLADGRFAVERATIAIAPSATALLALRAAPVPIGTRVVTFGDPSYPRRAAAAARDGVVATTDARPPFAAARLPRLPHSGTEARQVASFGLQRDVHLAGRASKSTVLGIDWRHVSVAHFAVHALVDPDGEHGTALALSPGPQGDGFLTPSELGMLEIRGALVTLSACRSSAGQVLWGEGLRGLTAPLLEAGARTVVATHWSIADRSVVPFVERFYSALATGRRVDDALRDAKLEAIRNGANIADWGSFTTIGDGSLRVALRQPGGMLSRWLTKPPPLRRDTTAQPVR
ncbi:MAG: CHAT domain-containing protein [Gemmatimonadaceae bacterium]|nr:CHAT domain-containing protein [Gemmatimonadaceae bacterium]